MYETPQILQAVKYSSRNLVQIVFRDICALNNTDRYRISS
jgi:hypothetical protein